MTTKTSKTAKKAIAKEPETVSLGNKNSVNGMTDLDIFNLVTYTKELIVDEMNRRKRAGDKSHHRISLVAGNMQVCIQNCRKLQNNGRSSRIAYE